MTAVELSDAERIELLTEALERFTDRGNFVQVDTDVPANWTAGDVFISKLLESPFLHAEQILTKVKS